MTSTDSTTCAIEFHGGCQTDSFFTLATVSAASSDSASSDASAQTTDTPSAQTTDAAPSPALTSPSSTSPSTTATTASATPTASTTSPTLTHAVTLSSSVAAVTSPNAGAIAGGVIGGAIFLVLVLLGILLYLRARKRKRTPPSSEFMNSLKPGAPPVLRLDSGAEYTPALAEKGGFGALYPPTTTTVPLPFQQHTDEMMMLTDIPSRRPSVETPLHPQRLSLQPSARDPFVPQRHHQLSSSVGSKRELLGHDADLILRGASPEMHFAQRFSSDESLDVPRSVSPLQPLRRS